MSPAGFSGSIDTDDWYVNGVGTVYSANVCNPLRLRPVINLKADTYVSGSGTSSSPYVVVNTYNEKLLNGADPVLTNNLVPVEIGDDGTVKKANVFSDWYSYEEKRWANAVVLTGKDNYNPGDLIEEDKIESYFVWIPKYSYQLWDLGNYSSLTSIDTSKPHAIPIKFGLTNTSDANTGECTTPGVAGESGNCKVGDYMTHPAFLAFNTNGIWVGKFETGYNGATTKQEAQTGTNIFDINKIIIKPNAYSWRNINVGNALKNSLDYISDDNSHMMKNTEWGAVAYLSHSDYGINKEIRINNNSSYITGYSATVAPTLGYNKSVSIEGNRVESTTRNTDGMYTVNYLNNQSVLSSTTGNYTGIYDMSGGAWEYTMGYTTSASTVGGSSEITTIYDDFYTNDSYEKYYDKYTSPSYKNYTNRILGDATGEVGPFLSQLDPDEDTRIKSSWYGDFAYFINSSSSWLIRGGLWNSGTNAGALAFNDDTGGTITYISFRIVLAPNN